jgi:hypothetical protein
VCVCVCVCECVKIAEIKANSQSFCPSHPSREADTHTHTHKISLQLETITIHQKTDLFTAGNMETADVVLYWRKKKEGEKHRPLYSWGHGDRRGCTFSNCQRPELRDSLPTFGTGAPRNRCGQCHHISPIYTDTHTYVHTHTLSHTLTDSLTRKHTHPVHGSKPA